MIVLNHIGVQCALNAIRSRRLVLYSIPVQLHAHRRDPLTLTLPIPVQRMYADPRCRNNQGKDYMPQMGPMVGYAVRVQFQHAHHMGSDSPGAGAHSSW
jgi:hypothetical protein